MSSSWLSYLRFFTLCVVVQLMAWPCGSAADTASAKNEDGYNVIAVCSQQLRTSLEPWLQHRSEQGYRTMVVPATPNANAKNIRDSIRQIAASNPVESIVLVGDVPLVPTHFEKAVVNVSWGSEPEIASDNWFADLDDDAIPDVAIGRLSVDNSVELDRVVNKIIRYENEPISRPWPRRVNLVAGVGGFGAIADKILENATRSFITKGIPAEYRTSTTYASWRSPYCPDPRHFRDATIERMNEGSLLWIYIGHGQRRNLDLIRVPAGVAPIFQEHDVDKVAAESGAPIAVFLSCYAGAFDEANDCLGERLVAAEKGPVAAVCGSRVTMPYAMAVLGNEMLRECFANRQTRLGDVILNAKRRSMEVDANDGQRRLLDALAKSISPHPEKIADERKEHLWLFNLLGDPLLQIRHPRQVEISGAKAAFPGDEVTIDFDCPCHGKAIIELTCPRGRFTFDPPTRSEFDASDAGMASMTDTYRLANQDSWLRQDLDVAAGGNSTKIKLADHIRGPTFVRIFVTGESDFAMGSHQIYVRRRPKE
ncbi:MAG: hypothetical protein KDB27_31605 [Planctomycetales bacterium]|nr:hypothetical protein [Planctomycetales bacterium]